MTKCTECGSTIVREITDGMYQITTFEWNKDTNHYEKTNNQKETIGEVWLECPNGHQLSGDETDAWYNHFFEGS